MFLLAILVAAGAWVITTPRPLEDAEVYAQNGDAEHGRDVFYIGGCASCHAVKGAEGDAKLVLSGGQAFASDFGTFYAPNITPNAEFGIGEWSNLDLANALIKGISPEGQHYYPAFPYTSYARMTPEDVVDLRAFLATLPDSTAQNRSHDLPLLVKFRRGLGLWKILYLNDDMIIPVSPELERGRYLVEGPGHCAECHTRRDIFGGLQVDSWMGGAPVPDGKGRVPNITAHKDGLEHWSAGEIADYLQSGFTPDFDSVGGPMVSVVDNLSHLSEDDLNAIAAYLKFIPPQAGR